MKYKMIAVVAGLFLGVITYVGIDWLGNHKDLLAFHDSRIESLQSDISDAALSYKENREDLLGEIRQLSGKLSVSEGDTRSMVANTDKVLRETAALAQRAIKVSVKPDEVLELHKELADLSRLVNEIRESTSKVRSDLDALLNIKETDEILREVIVDDTKSVDIVNKVTAIQPVAEPEKVAVACPSKPIRNDGAKTILAQTMRTVNTSGKFPLIASFDIGYDGYATDIEIAGSAPSKLRKAAKRYVTALRWDVDEPVAQCKFKLKFDIS